MSRPNTRPKLQHMSSKTRIVHVSPAPDSLEKLGEPPSRPMSTASSEAQLMDNKPEEECCDGECSCGSSGKPVWKLTLKLLACLLCGVVFGMSLEKGRVFEPKNIRGQMLLKRWVMMKMFLAATTTSVLIYIVLSVIPQTKERFQSVVISFKDCLMNKGVLSVMLGTFLLGSGMTIAGACPGMVLAQVGAFAENSGFTLLGGLTGALVYGMVAPYMIKWTIPKAPYKNHFAWEKFKLPFFGLAIPLFILLLVVVILLEVFVPYETELDVPNKNFTDPFTIRAWPPALAGSLIGLIQLPLFFLVMDSLGSSSAYTVIVSQPFIGRCARKHFPYLVNFRCGLSNWWQVFYVGGAIIGGLMSSLLSDTHGTVAGSSIGAAFAGGFIMLFGSRLGSGCTSGHGLSGMALIANLSLLAVPTMFAGGIATAFIMWAAVDLDTARFYAL